MDPNSQQDKGTNQNDFGLNNPEDLGSNQEGSGANPYQPQPQPQSQYQPQPQPQYQPQPQPQEWQTQPQATDIINNTSRTSTVLSIVGLSISVVAFLMGLLSALLSQYIIAIISAILGFAGLIVSVVALVKSIKSKQNKLMSIFGIVFALLLFLILIFVYLLNHHESADKEVGKGSSTEITNNESNSNDKSTSDKNGGRANSTAKDISNTKINQNGDMIESECWKMAFPKDYIMFYGKYTEETDYEHKECRTLLVQVDSVTYEVINLVEVNTLMMINYSSSSSGHDEIENAQESNIITSGQTVSSKEKVKVSGYNAIKYVSTHPNGTSFVSYAIIDDSKAFSYSGVGVVAYVISGYNNPKNIKALNDVVNNFKIKG